MIALCTKHHPWADSGKWTKEDLRRMKQHPFLRSGRLVDENFSWRRRDLILAAGGFYVRPSVFLRLNGRNVVWCDRDTENGLQLNVDIRDRDDRPVILMQEDDWLELHGIENIQDIELSPRGHALVVKAPALGIRFEIKFREFTAQKLRRLGRMWRMELDSRPGLQEPLPAWMFEAMRETVPHSESDQSSEYLSRLYAMMQPGPTRWESLTYSIREWPVTVCTMSLRLQHPFPVDIRAGNEDVGGWRAGHTIAIDSGVVWDMRQ